MPAYDTFSTDTISDIDSPAEAERGPESTKTPVWAWRNAVAKAPKKQMPPLTRLVCHEISRHISVVGKWWRLPVKEIIAGTGMGNKAVAKHLQMAMGTGFIDMKRELGPHGQRGVTKYMLLIPEQANQPADLAADQARDHHVSSAPSVGETRGEPDVPETPGPRVPETLRTPGHVSVGHLDQVSQEHDKSFSTNDSLSSRGASNKEEEETSPLREDAQARPAPAEEPISVSDDQVEVIGSPEPTPPRQGSSRQRPKNAGRLPKQLGLPDMPQRPHSDKPHMNGMGFVISEALGLVIPTSTIDRWRHAFPEIENLEAKLKKLSSYILSGNKRHPGRVSPEEWIEGCLAEDQQKLAKMGRGRAGPGVHFEAMMMERTERGENGGW